MRIIALLLSLLPALTFADGCADLNDDGYINFGDLAEFRRQFGEDPLDVPGCYKRVEVVYNCMQLGDTPEWSQPLTLTLEKEGDCVTAILRDSAGNASQVVGPVCMEGAE